jgi:hypothetical protein
VGGDVITKKLAHVVNSISRDSRSGLVKGTRGTIFFADRYSFRLPVEPCLFAAAGFVGCEFIFE